MREHHIGAVLVTDPQGRLLGIASRGDFRAAELDRLEAESALRERM
jgi:CBS domain-containing protein